MGKITVRLNQKKRGKKKKMLFLVSPKLLHCWYTKCHQFPNIDFVSCYFTAFPFWSSSYLWNLESFLFTLWWHLWIRTVLLLPFQFGCLFFLPLVWSLCLAHAVLCWIRMVKADTLVFFPILKETLVVSVHWLWGWQEVFPHMAFILFRYAPSILILLSILS